MHICCSFCFFPWFDFHSFNLLKHLNVCKHSQESRTWHLWGYHKALWPGTDPVGNSDSSLVNGALFLALGLDYQTHTWFIVTLMHVEHRRNWGLDQQFRLSVYKETISVLWQLKMPGMKDGCREFSRWDESFNEGWHKLSSSVHKCESTNLEKLLDNGITLGFSPQPRLAL